MSAPSLFPDQLVSFTGVLLKAGEARAAMLDVEGHTAPVLLLDVELDGPLHNHGRFEQPFPPGKHAECAAAAHRYKKGMRVTLQAPAAGMRIVAPNTLHIHVHPSNHPEKTP